jgi:uroporphyrinogen III methyltransferase/synthase
LKGGDPAVFAHTAEEIAALDAAKIHYEIVPGITAAQAASSYAGIPLTHRDEASCVAFVTGQESAEKEPEGRLDYSALARFPGTLVFYMGVTRAAAWSRALIEHGKAPGTPVAVVRRCTLPDQQSIFTTLSELAERLREEHIRPPAVIIVGEVARKGDAANWFTSRPLFGRTVLVTRPESQSAELAFKLRDLGATVLSQPAITIGEPRDWKPVDVAIERVREFDWLVFSSSNGVLYFFERMLSLGLDMRNVASAKIAAIGPATAKALAGYHLKADVIPPKYRAEDLADFLIPHARGKRFLLMRASRGRQVLAEMLRTAGAIVEQVVVYESQDVAMADADIAEALAAGRIDWTTVTSAAIARSLVRLFGKALNNTQLVAISPLTAEVLKGLGYVSAKVAENYTTEGILAAILEAEGQRP